MRVRGVVLATVLAMAAAVPAAAQQMGSDSTAFLKAVRDRDGNKVQGFIDKPAASTLLQTRELGSGETALLIVTRRRDLAYLQFLLAKGAPMDQRDNAGTTPLAAAAQIGWTEGAQQLIDVGAQVDLANDHGETPLILATEGRDLTMVRLLLAAGADPRVPDTIAGLSALDYATRDPRAMQVLALLQTAKPKPKRTVAGPSPSGR